jgi:hypothetical protein
MESSGIDIMESNGIEWNMRHGASHQHDAANYLQYREAEHGPASGSRLRKVTGRGRKHPYVNPPMVCKKDCIDQTPAQFVQRGGRGMVSDEMSEPNGMHVAVDGTFN